MWRVAPLYFVSSTAPVSVLPGWPLVVCPVCVYGQYISSRSPSVPLSTPCARGQRSMGSTRCTYYRISVVKCTPPVYRTPFARGGSMYPLEVYPPLGGLVVPLA